MPTIKPKKILTGKKFGRLTVGPQAFHPIDFTYWHVICDCGTEKVVRSTHLTRGESKSCGCLKYESKVKPGDKFGRLTVIRKVENRKTKCVFECVCECGNKRDVPSHSLLSGICESCGCLRNERATKALIKRHNKNFPNGFVTAPQLVYKSYKLRASNTGIYFNISQDTFRSLCEKECHYCGEPPSNKKKYRGECWAYNGVDRLDSEYGYTDQNCVPCCAMCNQSKKALTTDQFEDWIRKVYWLYCVERHF